MRTELERAQRAGYEEAVEQEAHELLAGLGANHSEEELIAMLESMPPYRDVLRALKIMAEGS